MKYLMLCFAMLISLSSCKKEDIESKLPPETTTGANTAGFIVDGKTVVTPKYGYSSVPGGGSSGLSVYTGPNFSSPNNTRYFTLEIANYGEKPIYVAVIRIHEYPQEPKIYNFGEKWGDFYADGPNYPQMMIITKENDETQWYYSAPNSGHVTFTRADTTQRIFSGIFEATLYNRFDNTKTMTISQGRFDLGSK